jgi:hypothetical protein
MRKFFCLKSRSFPLFDKSQKSAIKNTIIAIFNNPTVIMGIFIPFFAKFEDRNHE